MPVFHSANGQNLRQLSGIVTDTLGKGVEHATIRIQAMSDSSSHQTFTDKDGQYIFGKLPEKSTHITSSMTITKA